MAVFSLPNFTIRQKLWLGFSSFLFILLIAVLIAIIMISNFKQQFSEVVDNDLPMVQNTMLLANKMEQSLSLLEMFLLSRDVTFKQKYFDSKKELDTLLLELEQHPQTHINPEIRRLSKAISKQSELFYNKGQDIIALTEDDQKNYPALDYSQVHLNPGSLELLQSISNLLQEDMDNMGTVKILYQMRHTWSQIVNELRGFLAHRGVATFSNIDAYYRVFLTYEAKLIAALGDDINFVQGEELKQIQKTRIQYMENLQQVRELHSSPQWRQDAYLLHTQVAPLLENIRYTINQLGKYEQQKMKNNNQDLLTWLNTLTSLSILAILAMLLLSALGSRRLVKSITTPLFRAVRVAEQVSEGDLRIHLKANEVQKDETGRMLQAMQIMVQHLSELVAHLQASGAQLSAATGQIAVTAREQEATVTEQAATANEIMSTATMISKSTRDLAYTMNEVTELAQNTSESAEAGHADLLRMEQSMHKMLDATDIINAKLELVQEKADNIGTVVTTITKIADQTNLLSLNAAIEAEKAGDYGLGFSVVAAEIRRLADQTAEATWDIEQIVKEMQSAVSGGVQGMAQFSSQIRHEVKGIDQVSQQLADIIERMKSLLPHFQTVREGMQGQTLSADEISDAISELNDSVRQTADSLSHSNQALQQLDQTAHDLHEGISIFKL
ncbi:methyl-accepting chemotaxis protein [Candidatus Venteria ishoeyi]|uniref:Methyl-accepting chemotaxis protein McpC n=1 Tax=Candidatus Venteria ishoeyi TaxID=1899563 RepID=A0A1H6FCP0_9GAMM|nr:methyl-accepting chemotaxis protein [Candidatus Venteria ishoeyi]MDM8545250.1 methyl-accepting chemotaxis protein [Candidatus Venteria ishoeyi]SEH07089.1 Methyl-accepting chemotaxis protein McpC [Candidatus Venteria ishoeyi]